MFFKISDIVIPPRYSAQSRVAKRRKKQRSCLRDARKDGINQAVKGFNSADGEARFVFPHATLPLIKGFNSADGEGRFENQFL